MRLLMLGGTGFVGRAVVAEALGRGGRVLTPGPPDLPLQYIDARDLAA